MLARRVKPIIVLLAVFCICWRQTLAHTLPNCKAELHVFENYSTLTLKASYEILQLASRLRIDLNAPASVDSLKNYLRHHLHLSDSLNSTWTIAFGIIGKHKITDALIGAYDEVVAEIVMQPSHHESLRNFVLSCDWVIHQIPNQSILISIVDDWQTGISLANIQQVGVISVDIPTGNIFPLKVRLAEGSWIEGTESMFMLGVNHIKDGTDHLLFIITLILPAGLTATRRQWVGYADRKTTILNLLKIVTAFSIGHSITLCFGAAGLTILPVRWIEVIIAISIFISAVHVLRPLFYGKEIFIAIGFGLIHGLAFSETLFELHLHSFYLITSIIAFNVGIEVMQIFIIAITIPWIVMLTNTTRMKVLKNILAVAVGIISAGWILERITGDSNSVTTWTDDISGHGLWVIAVLIITSASTYLYDSYSTPRTVARL